MGTNGRNFRFLRAAGSLSPPVDLTLNFTATGVLPTNPLGERRLVSLFSTGSTGLTAGLA